jgi:hypothetical protein
MAKENKTTENKESVIAFLKKVKDEQKRIDCIEISKIFSKHTGFSARMWGNAIVGFGSYHYKYESGREGNAPLIAFSPRSSSIVLYLSNAKEKTDLLKKLGKHKMGGGCIHIKSLTDVDTKVMLQLADNSIKYLNKLYPKK